MKKCSEGMKCRCLCSFAAGAGAKLGLSKNLAVEQKLKLAVRRVLC